MPDNRISATLSQADRQSVLDGMAQRFARKSRGTPAGKTTPDNP